MASTSEPWLSRSWREAGLLRGCRWLGPLLGNHPGHLISSSLCLGGHGNLAGRSALPGPAPSLMKDPKGRPLLGLLSASGLRHSLFSFTFRSSFLSQLCLRPPSGALCQPESPPALPFSLCFLPVRFFVCASVCRSLCLASNASFTGWSRV